MPSPRPAKLWPTPCQPKLRPMPGQFWRQGETTIPARRNGSTSQLGMRRLRRSVNVATASTMSVGHQANECIPMLLPPRDLGDSTYIAIVRPNRRWSQTISIWAVYGGLSSSAVHGCLRAVSRSEAGRIHPPVATSAGRGRCSVAFAEEITRPVALMDARWDQLIVRVRITRRCRRDHGSKTQSDGRQPRQPEEAMPPLWREPRYFTIDVPFRGIDRLKTGATPRKIQIICN